MPPKLRHALRQNEKAGRQPVREEKLRCEKNKRLTRNVLPDYLIFARGSLWGGVAFCLLAWGSELPQALRCFYQKVRDWYGKDRNGFYACLSRQIGH